MKELPKVYNTNLVISNIGNYFDEDIELKLIIYKEIFIGKEIFIIDDSVAKYLGNMYSDLKEYFKNYTWCYTELKILIITNGKDVSYARKSRYRV